MANKEFPWLASLTRDDIYDSIEGISKYGDPKEFDAYNPDDILFYLIQNSKKENIGTGYAYEDNDEDYTGMVDDALAENFSPGLSRVPSRWGWVKARKP